MQARSHMLSAAAVALLIAGPALAQSRPATPGSDLSRQDTSFVQEAATGGLAEVELGKLASQNAQDPQVKQFGERMVQDHGQANDQLKSIAEGKQMPLPHQLDAKTQALRDRLARLHGSAFDHAYMSAMVKDHDADAKAFGREAKSGQDAEVKQFAGNTLQVIQQHDKMAHDIAASLTATGSSQPRRR